MRGVVGSRGATGTGHRSGSRRAPRRRGGSERTERRSARRLAAGLRVAQPVQVGRGHQRRVAGDADVRPADRPQVERREHRLRLHRAGVRAPTCRPTARRSRSTSSRASTGRTGSRSRAPTRSGRSTPCCENKTNQFHGTIEAVKSVSAPDANTFVLHLSTRDSEFLDKLAIPILPKHIWSKYPIAQLDKIDGPIPTVTTAPYILTKWEKLGTTILTRNEKYDTFRNGGKLPEVKRILITYYANPDSIYRDVAQGQPRLRLRRPAVVGAPREDRQEPQGAPDLLAARRLLGDRVQLVPARRARRSAAAPARASRRPSCRIRRSARRWPTRSTASSSSRPSTTARARPPTASSRRASSATTSSARARRSATTTTRPRPSRRSRRAAGTARRRRARRTA